MHADSDVATNTCGSLLALYGTPAPAIIELLDDAESLMRLARGEAEMRDDLAGRIVGNVFLEDSTRTRCSFSVAAQRLGGGVVDLVGSSSSANKGETLVDTAITVAAMGIDALVIRTSASGGVALAARHVSCPVINAGDGRHEHPTQGLLDLLTLRRHLGDLTGRRVAIVGDIAGSRVARSAIHGLAALGASITLIGPPALVPAALQSIADPAAPGTVSICHDLDSALPPLDAIMMLRVQFERGSRIGPDYRQHFALTVERAAALPDHAIVLHPGPMNRGLEIDGAVADGPRSVIQEQVTGGVAVRMAVLRRLVGS